VTWAIPRSDICRGSGGIPPFILNVGTRREWLILRSGRFTPEKKNRYPLKRRSCGLQSGSEFFCERDRERERNLGIKPLMVQPVAHSLWRVIPAPLDEWFQKQVPQILKGVSKGSEGIFYNETFPVYKILLPVNSRLSDG
jgi:hypothetical protein